MKSGKIAVALSGGVDSAVAAILLKERGCDLAAVYLRLVDDNAGENQARILAEHMGIPFYPVNAVKEFKKRVIDYFLKEYESGRTPNPCVACNLSIKFGLLYDKVRSMGFYKMSTGHYIKSKSIRKLKELYAAKDKNKDQSYFLYNLTQDILAHTEFPLGGYTKKQARAMALKWRLPICEKESQDICFLNNMKTHGTARKHDHNDFLRKHLKLKKGDISLSSGRREKIGEHDGLPLYTVGQRRAVGIGGAGPYYVVGKDLKKNILFVSQDRDDPLLYSNELTAGQVNWISGKKPKLPLKIKAKIRYRHEAAEAVMDFSIPLNPPLSSGRAVFPHYLVKFKKSQRAITPGQSVVFYKGRKLIGGGVIQ